MTLALLAALALSAAAPKPVVPPPDGTTIAIKLGAERILSVPNLARIAVGDAQVADARPKDGERVTIKGLAHGRTELLVWTSDGVRRRYPVVVGDPKTAPANAQTQALDRVVSANAAGVVEELAMTLAVGEEKSVVYSNISKIGVTQDAPVVEVAPLDGAEGVRLKGKTVGTAKVLLHIDGRPAVRIAATVVEAAKGAAKGAAAPPAAPEFGGRVLDKPDCTGDMTTAETARLVAEAVDLDRAKKRAQAIEKLEKVVALQPGAAHAFLKLGSLYGKVGEKQQGAAAYETFVLSCPADPAVAKVRPLLDAFRKSGKKAR